MVIAKRKTNTLILIHRQQLLEQWREQLSVLFGIPPKSIGIIGGGRNKPIGLPCCKAFQEKVWFVMRSINMAKSIVS